MQNVYLVCCIGVSVVEWFSRPFLRHFIEHYLGAGIDPANFRLTLHSAEDDGSDLWCRDWLRNYGIIPIAEFGGPYDCYLFYEKNFEAMSKLPSDAWIVLIDFDELIFFPQGLPDFINTIEAGSYDLVMGHLIDRVAPNGQLLPIVEHLPIWDQFSTSCRLTRDVVGGDDRKTCLFRNYLTPSLGHHSVRQSATAKPYPSELPVYHFKWDEALPAKLAKRVNEFDQNRQKYPWYGEIYNVLRSIEAGRLVIPSETPVLIEAKREK
jgi:hypothetical protein